jgi:uncharacterized protein YjbI with pentapeptide repeats
MKYTFSKIKKIARNTIAGALALFLSATATAAPQINSISQRDRDIHLEWDSPTNQFVVKRYESMDPSKVEDCVVFSQNTTTSNIDVPRDFIHGNHPLQVYNLVTGTNVTEIPAPGLEDVVRGARLSNERFRNQIHFTEPADISYIIGRNLGLTNAVAIDSLPNLEWLDLRNNPGIRTIDFSSNPDIKYLNLSGCGLSNVDITTLNNLEELFLDNNRGIESIDLTSNVNLRSADMSHCNITNINASSLQNLQELSLSCNSNLGWNIRSIWSAIHTNIINIPSSIIKLDLSNCSISGSGEYPFTNMDFSAFYNLKELCLNNNWVGRINLSNNVNMVNLYLSNCHLTDNFNAGFMPNLRNVDLSKNYLKNIDFSSNSNLVNVVLSENLLTNFAIPSRQHLRNVNISKNSLRNISLNNSPNLHNLDVSFCTNLLSLAAFVSPNLMNVNMSSCTDLSLLNVGGCNLYKLDVGGLSKIVSLAAILNRNLCNVNLSSCKNLANLDLKNCNLREIDIRSSRNLRNLSLDSNTNLQNLYLLPLTNFPGNPGTNYLSQHTNLYLLSVPRCNFTNIDIRGLSRLSRLVAWENQNLSVIQLYLNNSLSNLDLRSCNFTNLNLSQAPNLYYVDVRTNPLAEIVVADTNHLPATFLYDGSPIIRQP